MLRHKRMIYDPVWFTVGATSFNNRSLGLIDENNGGRPICPGRQDLEFARHRLDQYRER